MSTQSILRKKFPTAQLIIFTFFSLTKSCLSNKEEKIRTPQQIASLVQSLGTKKIYPCEPVPGPFESVAYVRQAQIITDIAKSSLVLESIFRDSVKTLWQPLNSNFVGSSNSFAMGLKNQPHVIDFQAFKHGETHWAFYRYKVAGREIYKAAIERIKSGEVVKSEVPNALEDSVQELWLLPSSDGSGAHVITRSNTTLETADEGTNSLLTWFTFDNKVARLRKISEVTLAVNDFLPKTFLKTASLNEEPFAVGTSTQGTDQIIKISKLFARNKPQLILHSDSNPISSLVAYEHDFSQGRVHLTWLRESQMSAYPTIVVGEFTLQKSSNPSITLNNSNGLKETRFFRSSLSGFSFKSKMQTLLLQPPHLSHNLKFMKNPKNSKQLFLTWTASFDNDYGLILNPLNLNNLTSANQLVALYNPLIKTRHLGNGFLHTGEFAFVTGTQVDSQDQQKPTKIQLCRMSIPTAL